VEAQGRVSSPTAGYHGAGRKAKVASELDGMLVNKVDSTNLKPTDYSPLR
jgi:hypothetical protein